MDEKQQNPAIILELDNWAADIKKPEETDGFWLADFIREIAGKDAEYSENLVGDRRDRVTSFFEKLGFGEYLDDFKKRQPSGMMYWFYNDEKEIIKKILETNKEIPFKGIRTKKYNDIPRDERLRWIEEIMAMFVRRGKNGMELHYRMKKPIELLFTLPGTKNETISLPEKAYETLQKTYEIALERKRITSMISDEALKYLIKEDYTSFENFDQYEDLVLAVYQRYIETVMEFHQILYQTNEYPNFILRKYGIEVQKSSDDQDI